MISFVTNGVSACKTNGPPNVVAQENIVSDRVTLDCITVRFSDGLTISAELRCCYFTELGHIRRLLRGKVLPFVFNTLTISGHFVLRRG